MKTDLFQSCGHCWVFQICWHIECSTFMAFRIWNSSTGIPSPPLALLIVMPPKAHLTSHSRMSGSRWMITPSWLSGSWRSYLYSSSGYSCHLFLISSASVRSLPFLSFIEPIFAWNVPLVSLKRSLVFPLNRGKSLKSNKDNFLLLTKLSQSLERPDKCGRNEWFLCSPHAFLSHFFTLREAWSERCNLKAESLKNEVSVTHELLSSIYFPPSNILIRSKD